MIPARPSLAGALGRRWQTPTMPKPPKRPRDPMQLAKLIGDVATGQVPSDSPKQPDTRATEARRKGRLKGGKARASKPRYSKELFRALAPLGKWWTSQCTATAAKDEEFQRLAAGCCVR